MLDLRQDMTADAQMEASLATFVSSLRTFIGCQGYVKDAGMEGLFEDPKPSGFADILSWEF